VVEEKRFIGKFHACCALFLAAAASAWSAVSQAEECLNMARPEQGLYATVYKHAITLTQGGKTIVLNEGEAGFSNAQGLTCLGKRPEFLDEDQVPWPAFVGATGRGTCGINHDYNLLVEFDGFFKAGYPVPSSLLHAIAKGHTIDEAIYVAISAQPERAQEIYGIALSMLPSLPGWACGTTDNQLEYFGTYNVTEMPTDRTVAEVARRYFKDRKELYPFPDWAGGDFHMLVSLEEVLKLAGPQFWYQNGPDQDIPGSNPRDTIMVGLYDNGDRVVIDRGLPRLQKLQELGLKKVPVVFYFNRDNQRPVSDFQKDGNLQEIIDAYFTKGLELSPPPLWQVGDFHKKIAISELEKIFDIPTKSEIGEDAFNKIVARLKQDGFKRSPMLITLLGDAKSKFLAEAARVRAAAELGMESVPVVVFYHKLDRLPCGAPANCVQRLCDAALCAGADASVCNVNVRPSGTAFAPPGGGGGIPPPPPPPPMMPPPMGPPSPR